MSGHFYRRFEEKYRGSRELIKARLTVYLPLIQPLKKIYSDLPVVDLGCGRGEWLELLGENGFDAVGVDLNEDMLSACSERNLHGRIGDAITYLNELPARSQVIVSAFHLVEHISFEDLQTLVKESLRVLKAGGLLIMETPNPENIVVSTRDFYLDPTHQKPIPPNLLAFLPSFHGFCRSKILRLQESAELVQKEYPGLDDVLSGASPDYAVVAQKKQARQI